MNRVMLAGAVLLIAMLSGGAALAATASDWGALTTTVFHSIGEVGGSSVTAVAEDGDGYLWVGGQSGLSRWDGYRFRSYMPDPQVAGSLPDSYINVLHADRHGRLWIGTSSGGLARYERDSDDFVTYSVAGAGLAANSVTALADDDTNGLWIGTTGGLDHLIDRSSRVEHFRHDARVPGSLPANTVNAVLRDHRGTLWVATEGGLAKRTRGARRFDLVTLPGTDGEAAVASALFEDSDGRIWVGTLRHGVYLIGPDRRGAQPFRPAGGGEAGRLLASGRMRAINEVRRGEIWFGTYDRGIVSLDVATQRLSLLHNDPAIPTSLPQNSIFAIYRDRADAIWVGTLSGLRRTNPRETGIATIMVGSGASANLSSPDVTAIFAAPGNRVWLGFGSNGIDIVDPVRGRIRMLRPDSAHPLTALPDSAVRAIAGSPAGPVYIGTDRGLYRSDADGGHLRRIPMPAGSRDDVTALFCAGDVLWIGTEAAGVWRLDPHATTPRRLDAAGLLDNRITVLAGAPNEHLWIGTFSGLNLLDTRSGRGQRISADTPEQARLGTELIASLLTDARGRVWVGTFGGGIAIINRLGRDGRAHFVQLSRHEGLPNVNVDVMLRDRQNHIWVATDDGIAVIDPTTLAIRTLHSADGVELPGYYVGSGAKLENDDMFFGSTGGATIVRPELVRDWTYAPPVVVTDVRVGGKTIAANAMGRGVPLLVTPQANSLAVEFAALDFSAPERNRYAYMLAGFDADWTETDPSRRLAAYTNLPPGNYRLELRASNRSGVWSAATLTVPIRVVPAWHQTIAFKIAEVLVLFGFSALLVRLRTASLRRREHELAAQVSQRTAELQALAIELRESKNQLEHIAYRDPLTNLPNRRMFSETLERLLSGARRDRTELTLLLIDLDRFKLVNDAMGHDAGDALLVEAAIRLGSVVRDSDCVARLGGDEFAIVLGDEADIDAICARIVASFVPSVAFNDATIKTSASIGVAQYPIHGSTPDELYKSADLALYEAKRAGRDTWRRFGLELA